MGDFNTYGRKRNQENRVAESSIDFRSTWRFESKTVVDIGAGSGYFTFKLAKAAEKVIALDIDPLALEYIEEQKEVLGNWTSSIETRLTEPNQPELKEQEVDAVLVVNTFAYIPEQEKYFKRLTKGLKVNGTLLIVDFKEEIFQSDQLRILR